MHSETDAIKQRYMRRAQRGDRPNYDPLAPWVLASHQERERAIAGLIRQCGLTPVGEKRLLEIGCGSGANLLMFLRLGFHPENVVANELLEDRAREARHLLPQATQVLVGDASELDLRDGFFDVVYQSTVFTSILDPAFQAKLADRMWSLVKPGGGVMWYDFVFNNPSNPDVRGVPVRRIRELFPEGRMHVRRVTLAPPISRLVTKLHPSLYALLNAVPWLRTHVLCWIGKPGP